MKKMVSDANKKGGPELKCEACHEGVNDDRYDLLKKDGRDRFTKLLADLKPKR
jgi:hypothetical protein